MRKITTNGIRILFGMALISIFLLPRHQVKAAGVYAFAPDINSDGCVDKADLLAFGQQRSSTTTGSADVDDSGKLDMRDTAYVMQAYPGCLTGWSNGAPTGNTMYKVQSGGLNRSYIVHTPPGYSGQPLPLVLNFHGGTGQSNGQEIITKMDASANANNYIVAYPNGTSLSTSPLDTMLYWNPGLGPQGYLKPLTGLKNIDDVSFTNAMLDQIESNYAINTKKVYATGLSNGAMFSQRLACHLENRITAVAAVEGSLWEYASSCTPSRAIPLLIIHGTSDNYIPYNGGAPTCTAMSATNWSSVDTVASTWKSINSCTSSFTTTNPSSDMSCQIYSSCASGSAVTVCTVQNGGHTWPGGLPYIPPSTDPSCAIGNISTANGDQLIWNFFDQFTLP